MKKLLLTAAALVSFAALTSAGAADLPAPVYQAPPPSPPPLINSWTGFYVGGAVGGAWLNEGTYFHTNQSPGFALNPITANDNGVGFTAGAHAGYNYQFAPTWVVGVEGDWTWTHVKGSFTQTGTIVGGIPISPGSYTTMQTTADWLASVRARVGFLVTPELMVYGTGGGAWGQFSYSGSDCPGGQCLFTANFRSSVSSGYVAGGGVEWLFAGNWSLRGEYLFYHLNTARSVVTTSPLVPGDWEAFAWNDAEISEAELGLNYRF